ncbi:NEL-type E3 ubiquitin ligase domain-containing protein [Pseudomonas lundensis]|uniref:NEL-type E3 ubiquitin ligase domain-containing protein n=1 Tax=Pseudomonas lundensis TaxID=86185 RepID=UPI00089DB6FC|nr:NEL-type E3 ubiquitin ligase domain-containing protein [Pseudomonas lundensis]
MNKEPSAPDTFHPQALLHMDETSEAVKQNMPLWLLQADDDTRQKVIQAFITTHALEQQLAAHLSHVVAPTDFAKRLLNPALSARWGREVDSERNIFVNVQRFSFNPLGDAIREPLDIVLPTKWRPITSMTHLTLLEAAMQNFSREEVEQDFNGVAFILEHSGSAKRTGLNPQHFAQLCRTLNVGGQYQTYLKTLFYPYERIDRFQTDLSGYGIYSDFITHAKSQLELLSHQACLTHAIGVTAYQMLLQWVRGEPQPRWGRRTVRVSHMTMLSVKHDGVGQAGCPLHGVLVFMATPENADNPLPCLVYTPHDQERPLYEYASLQRFNDLYAVRLREEGAKAALIKTVKQRYQTEFAKQLDHALCVKGKTTSLVSVETWRPRPDLQIQLSDSGHTPFVTLYTQFIDSVLSNARFVMVPTQEQDTSLLTPLTALFEAALPFLNLAAFFVPLVGELLLFSTSVQLLSQIYVGVEDWSHGEVKQAFAHFESVAQNLIVLLVGARATIAWSSFNPEIAYPSLIETLRRVNTAADETRLMKVDLAPFISDVQLPEHLQPDNDGIYHTQDRAFVHIKGQPYEIKHDEASQHWRVQHPKRQGAYAPVVEHNAHGGWFLGVERAGEWDKVESLHRASPHKSALSESEVEHVLNIVGAQEDALRWSHANREPPPALVLDTLKRWKLVDDVERLVDRLQASESVRWSDNRHLVRLLERMPGWPEGTWVQIVGADGHIILDVTLAGEWRTPVRVNMTDVQQRGLLTALTAAMDDALAASFLGADAITPQQRADALVNKVAAFAMTQKKTLFSEAYTASEVFTDGPMQTLHRHNPTLPASVVSEVLRHASVSEVRSLNSLKKVPLRLAQELRLYSHALKVARALEGCYLDVEDPAPSLRLIGAFFLKTAQGKQYLSAEQEPLLRSAQDGTLLNSAQTLRALALVKSDPLLRDQLVAYAHGHLDETRLALGLQPIKPWFKSPMQLARGRVGYPLSGRGSQAGRSAFQIRRVKSLYPQYTHTQCEAFIRALEKLKANPEAELVRRELEYEALQDALRSWLAQPLPEYSMAARRDVSPLTIKRAASHVIGRAWRRETRLQDEIGNLHEYVEDADLSAQDLPDARRYVLDLSGMPVGDLPTLPGSFRHISVLIMDDMALNEVPEGFLECFPDLRWLSMENNRLTTLPRALTQMKGLLKLNLAHNEIALTPETVGTLAGLTALRELNLGNNPLGQTLEVTGMQRLRHIDLRHTGTTHWPSGVETLNDVAYLDLRENNITQIPDAVFNAQERLNAVTYVHDNPLTPVSEQRLDSYAERTGINMGYVSARGHSFLTDPSSYSWFLGGPEALAAKKLEIWQNLEQDPQTQDLRRVLMGLTATPAYANESTRDSLIERVGTMLLALGDDTELRESLMLRAGHGSTCGDGLALIFSDLEVLTLVAKAKEPVGEEECELKLLRLARSLYRLDQVEVIARHLMQERYARGRDEQLGELNELDEVEFRLAFRIALAGPLELPAQPQAMEYEHLADVSQMVIDGVRYRVLANERSTHNLFDSICEREFWVDFLKKKYAHQFAAILERHIARTHEVEVGAHASSDEAYKQSLEKISEDYKAACKAWVQRLTHWEMTVHPF